MKRAKPTISVIVSTYNSPGCLWLVLFALSQQNTAGFEVIVVDDGSTADTKAVIDIFKTKVSYQIVHVWQEHRGFRVAMARNKGVARAAGEYLIFLDGDTVPQVSFVARHRELAEKGYFVAGNRLLLSATFTERIVEQHIPIHKWQWLQWLYAFCCKKVNRFLPVLFLGNWYWRYLYCKRWQGVKTCNLGIWKADFLAVNGFDESFSGWGYEDSDLVVRLIRYGVLRKDGRFMVPVLHLWHKENNRDRERDNYTRLTETIKSSHVRAKLGVDQYIPMTPQNAGIMAKGEQ